MELKNAVAVTTPSSSAAPVADVGTVLGVDHSRVARDRRTTAPTVRHGHRGVRRPARPTPEELGVFEPGFPQATAPDDVAWTLALDDALLDRNLAALRCQATQTATVIDAMGAHAFCTWWRTETFRTPHTHEITHTP